VPEDERTSAPARERCARCNRELCRGEVTYLVRVVIKADWKERIADTGEESLSSYLARIGPRIEGLPPELLEEEIHREIEGRLCMRCKEQFTANPFGRVAGGG
jgi:hypothetical protein